MPSEQIPSGGAPGAAGFDAQPEFDLSAFQSIEELDPDGEAGLVKELTETFIQDATEKIAQVRQRLQSGDAAGIHMLTHQLKSSAATLGLARLALLSKSIDDDARVGGLQVAERLMSTLEGALESAVRWLRERAGAR